MFVFWMICYFCSAMWETENFICRFILIPIGIVCAIPYIVFELIVADSILSLIGYCYLGYTPRELWGEVFIF